MLDGAREGRVDVVCAPGGGFAPFLAAGEEAFVDRDNNELREGLWCVVRGAWVVGCEWT